MFLAAAAAEPHARYTTQQFMDVLMLDRGQICRVEAIDISSMRFCALFASRTCNDELADLVAIALRRCRQRRQQDRSQAKRVDYLSIAEKHAVPWQARHYNHVRLDHPG